MYFIFKIHFDVKVLIIQSFNSGLEKFVKFLSTNLISLHS